MRDWGWSRAVYISGWDWLALLKRERHVIKTPGADQPTRSALNFPLPLLIIHICFQRLHTSPRWQLWTCLLRPWWLWRAWTTPLLRGAPTSRSSRQTPSQVSGCDCRVSHVISARHRCRAHIRLCGSKTCCAPTQPWQLLLYPATPFIRRNPSHFNHTAQPLTSYPVPRALAATVSDQHRTQSPIAAPSTVKAAPRAVAASATAAPIGRSHQATQSADPWPGLFASFAAARAAPDCLRARPLWHAGLPRNPCRPKGVQTTAVECLDHSARPCAANAAAARAPQQAAAAAPRPRSSSAPPLTRPPTHPTPGPAPPTQPRWASWSPTCSSTRSSCCARTTACCGRSSSTCSSTTTPSSPPRCVCGARDGRRCRESPHGSAQRLRGLGGCGA